MKRKCYGLVRQASDYGGTWWGYVRCCEPLTIFGLRSLFRLCFIHSTPLLYLTFAHNNFLVMADQVKSSRAKARGSCYYLDKRYSKHFKVRKASERPWNLIHIGIYILFYWILSGFWKCVQVRSHDFGEGRVRGGTYVGSSRKTIVLVSLTSDGACDERANYLMF
jgi:hypothetical protein